MIQFTCTKDLTWKRKNSDTKRTLRSHYFIEIKKLRKYISGILYIDIDETDLEGEMNQFINDQETLITHISLSPKSNLYPIYWKKNVSYHP